MRDSTRQAKFARTALQWSRSHSGAEWTSGSVALKANRLRFNGAAPIQERNDFAAIVNMPARKSFNGAAPIQERNAKDKRHAFGRTAHGFNGAAPIQERNAPCHIMAFRNGRSFNGAAPIQERNARAHPGGRVAWRAFNGAAPIQERNGNVPVAPRTGRADGLQWSRSHSGAEWIGTRAVARLASLNPSMEPLPFRSGMKTNERCTCSRRCTAFNGAAPIQERNALLTRVCGSLGRTFNGAAPIQERNAGSGGGCSTGFGAFNGAAPIQERNAVNGMTRAKYRSASMEPLPFRSGMRVCINRSKGSDLWLQWSRSHSGAEWSTRLAKNSSGSWLQWSRSHSGAECLEHPQGPRPCRPELQWSRSHSGAE